MKWSVVKFWRLSNAKIFQDTSKSRESAKTEMTFSGALERYMDWKISLLLTLNKSRKAMETQLSYKILSTKSRNLMYKSTPTSTYCSKWTNSLRLSSPKWHKWVWIHLTARSFWLFPSIWASVISKHLPCVVRRRSVCSRSWLAVIGTRARMWKSMKNIKSQSLTMKTILTQRCLRESILKTQSSRILSKYSIYSNKLSMRGKTNREANSRNLCTFCVVWMKRTSVPWSIRSATQSATQFSSTKKTSWHILSTPS